MISLHAHTRTGSFSSLPPSGPCGFLKSKLLGTAGIGFMHPGAPAADTVTVPPSWHLSL